LQTNALHLFSAYEALSSESSSLHRKHQKTDLLNMAAEVGRIAQLLDATLDPHQHRKGVFARSMKL
jgi:hypothetical protein